MRLSARVRANRRNARLSTGPRSAAGKARVARNARRHGLAVPVAADEACTEAVAALANAIAGVEAGDERRALAQRIAEAEIDLLRIRRARHLLLTQARHRFPRMDLSDWHRMLNQLGRSAALLERVVTGTLRRGPQALSVTSNVEATLDFWDQRLRQDKIAAGQIVPEPGEVPQLAEAFALLGPKLAALERYERRAFARRRSAIAALARAAEGKTRPQQAIAENKQEKE